MGDDSVDISDDVINEYVWHMCSNGDFISNNRVDIDDDNLLAEQSKMLFSKWHKSWKHFCKLCSCLLQCSVESLENYKEKL